MMTEVSFTVDPDGLDGLRGRLNAIESGMRGIGDTAASYQPLDLGPNPDVWTALQTFHSDWSNGLAMISGNVQALLGLLAGAAGDYRGTDQQIALAAVPKAGPG
jgi:hypothetical protein